MNSDQYLQETLKILNRIKEEDMIYELQSRNPPTDVLVDRIREIRMNISIGNNLEANSKEIQIVIERQWEELQNLSEKIDRYAEKF
jgi:hypothetical protein